MFGEFDWCTASKALDTSILLMCGDMFGKIHEASDRHNADIGTKQNCDCHSSFARVYYVNLPRRTLSGRDRHG
jgi:hypothetical protein